MDHLSTTQRHHLKEDTREWVAQGRERAEEMRRRGKDPFNPRPSDYPLRLAQPDDVLRRDGNDPILKVNSAPWQYGNPIATLYDGRPNGRDLARANAGLPDLSLPW